MMESIYKIFQFLYQMPVFIRYLLLTIGLILVVQILLLGVKVTLRLVTVLLYNLFYFIGISVIYRLIFLIMKKKRQNGGVASTGFEKIEEFISNILKLILKIRRLSWDMPINMKKRLKFISALFIFGIPIMMYSMPESDAANAIIKYEQKYLMSPILGESYVSNLPMDNDESVFETNLLVELSKENGGGVIRNNPDYNSSKIYEIEPKQQIPFTGEKATGQSKGIVWYKVEYKKGHYGWISSNIVDVIKK